MRYSKSLAEVIDPGNTRFGAQRLCDKGVSVAGVFFFSCTHLTHVRWILGGPNKGTIPHVVSRVRIPSGQHFFSPSTPATGNCPELYRATFLYWQLWAARLQTVARKLCPLLRPCNSQTVADYTQYRGRKCVFFLKLVPRSSWIADVFADLSKKKNVPTLLDCTLKPRPTLICPLTSPIL